MERYVPPFQITTIMLDKIFVANSTASSNFKVGFSLLFHVGLYDEIANALGIAEKTVRKAVKALINIDFKDVELKRKLAWFKCNDESFKVIG